MRTKTVEHLLNDGDVDAAIGRLKQMVLRGVEAEAQIGALYEEREEYGKALEWYQAAVDRYEGPRGYEGLGRLYFRGAGVERDYEKAWRCFIEASYLEDPTTYFLLGLMSHLGLGTAVDLSRARDYYTRGSQMGHLLARKALAEVDWKQGYRMRAIARWLSANAAIAIAITRNPLDDRLREI